MEKSNNGLEFRPILFGEDYRKQWNINCCDYVSLYKGGKPVNDSVYRIGGMGANLNDDYMLILKYVEEFYDDRITTNKKDKPHLGSRWCIVDRYGKERVEFNQFEVPYLVKGTHIYSINSNYYNIETGEFYCNASSAIESIEYLFLYDYKKGVIKINKKDGSFELFK